VVLEIIFILVNEIKSVLFTAEEYYNRVILCFGICCGQRFLQKEKLRDLRSRTVYIIIFREIVMSA